MIPFQPGEIGRLALAGIRLQRGLGSAPISKQLSEAAGSCVGQSSWHTNLDLRALVCVAGASEVCTNSLCALRHPTQSPMTVCRVRKQCDCIEAPAVVAAAHSELTLLIVEFYGDSRRFGVTKSIRQRLSRNAENLVYYLALENVASSPAFYREINCRSGIEISGHTLN